MKILKGLLMIITAPVTLVLTLFVWLCTGLIYICLLYTSAMTGGSSFAGGKGRIYAFFMENHTEMCIRDRMMPQLAKEAGATEELKASDPMKWVGLMNTCKAPVSYTHLDVYKRQIAYCPITTIC